MKRLFLLVIPAILMTAVSCEDLLGDDQNGENGGGGNVEFSQDIPSAIDMSCDKDTVEFFFYATKKDEAAAWKIESSAAWCKVEPSEGEGSSDIKVSVSENTGAIQREATLTISSGKKKVSVPVKQSLFAGALPAESWMSKNYYERTDREQAGLRGPVKSWCIDKYVDYKKYYFDEAGHLVKEESHDQDKGTVTVDWEHSYDAAGHRVRSFSSYNDEVIASYGQTITFEYANTGKFVATSPFCWIQPLYTSGKSLPLTILKDLSAMHYEDNSPVYYEKTDYTYAFNSDGNLVITETDQVGRDPSTAQTYTYTVVYQNGYPVSCEKEHMGPTTYASNGMPLTHEEYDGGRKLTFVRDAITILTESFREPDANGMVAMFWADYTYNAAGDVTLFRRAYFNPDQVYTDTTWKYHYDSYGNWVRRTEISEPAFQHGEFFTDVIPRTIEYYK